jgi:hypothetical protein
MPTKTERDNFKSTTKAALASRSAFQCAICKAVTIGPSKESPKSVCNIGVAAHITAAKERGPRFDATMTSTQRSDISNGIWLCQNHAKQIDDDVVNWTVLRLHKIKRDHETLIHGLMGFSSQSPVADTEWTDGHNINVRECAFATVGTLESPYRTVIDPILKDRVVSDEDQIGLLLCGTSPDEYGEQYQGTPWTLFVKSDWLHWVLAGQSSGYQTNSVIPKEQILGQIPAWPESFFEFLHAIVLADATFQWRRHPDGYLVLCQ